MGTEQICYTLIMRSYRNDPELKEFMLVLRRALLMVCRYIEQKYGIEEKGEERATAV